eukprot:GHVL01010669.1.p1 GENE.GHVL01010669.1~~GHVL01010669.1.p1  ORF type:complete len:392 (+),score=51.00 GHVL01010669.1:152-1327(+)
MRKMTRKPVETAAFNENMNSTLSKEFAQTLDAKSSLIKGNTTSRRPLGDIANTLNNNQEVQLSQLVKPAKVAVARRSKRLSDKKKTTEIISTSDFARGPCSIDECDLSECDKANRYDALCVAPYIQTVLTHMKNEESKYMTTSEHLEAQPDISSRMRSILVDWIVEVHQRFKLKQETLYLAINYLDRFLAKKTISRSKLQLVGTSCLWIACKYEEVYQPEIRDFEFITDKACSREDLLDMESVILNTLDFDLCVPSPWRFLERYLKVAGVPLRSFVHHMAEFFLECTLGDTQFLKWKASQLAAACVYLAKKACKVTPNWSDDMTKQTGFEQQTDIRKPAKELCAVINSLNSSQYQAVRIKYASDKYRGVSKEVVPGPVPECSTAGRNTKRE